MYSVRKELLISFAVKIFGKLKSLFCRTQNVTVLNYRNFKQKLSAIHDALILTSASCKIRISGKKKKNAAKRYGIQSDPSKGGTGLSVHGWFVGSSVVASLFRFPYFRPEMAHFSTAFNDPVQNKMCCLRR